ncbi:MAG TPA: DUF3380 domain-containing protein [Persephonella sp.]|uniref:N-acetylmuramidase domain-containing protein n=1 Tax=Persephonella TaxID=182899 RepID=UPI0005A2E4CF|nr:MULTISPECIES: N-acetylmuramidase domain-containing protein [Persephonella]HCB69334.1 DUF3380 domain-containing protein [Persephonella sp.]
MKTLAEIIKQIESSNNKLAVRFEPHFYERLKNRTNDTAVLKIREIHKCTYYTALMIASTSWGYFQIMGYNLYFYNLIDTTVFEFLYNEELQEKAFQEFIEKRKINFSVEELKSDPEKIRRFARYYNGDEIGYARKIEKLLRV